jgi:hypothetical protein
MLREETMPVPQDREILTSGDHSGVEQAVPPVNIRISVGKIELWGLQIGQRLGHAVALLYRTRNQPRNRRPRFIFC